MKRSLIAFIFALASHAAAAAPAFESCAHLNAWNNFGGLPDRVCVAYASPAEPGDVVVTLSLLGRSVATIEARSSVRPGGVTCNRHTGDCRSYPAALIVSARDGDYAVELAYADGVSGKVTNLLHAFTQYTDD